MFFKWSSKSKELLVYVRGGDGRNWCSLNSQNASHSLFAGKTTYLWAMVRLINSSETHLGASLARMLKANPS